MATRFTAGERVPAAKLNQALDEATQSALGDKAVAVQAKDGAVLAQEGAELARDATQDMRDAAAQAAFDAIGLKDAAGNFAAASAGSAGTATQQAGIATTKAGEAAGSAGTATTQAGLADASRQQAQAIVASVPIVASDRLPGFSLIFRDDDGQAVGGVLEGGAGYSLGGLTARWATAGGYEITTPYGPLAAITPAGAVTLQGIPVGQRSDFDGFDIVQIFDGGEYNGWRTDPRDGALRRPGYDPVGGTDAAAVRQIIRDAVFGPLDLIRACWLGDSNTAHAVDNDVNLTRNSARGYATWLRFFSGGRIVAEQADNYGVPGLQSDGMLARANAAAAKGGYQLAGIMIGTNDLSFDVSADTIVANAITAAQTMRAAGARVVMLPILPRRTLTAGYAGPLTGAQLAAKQAAVIRTLREWAVSQVGVRWADPRRRVTDPATGIFYTGMNYDSLHTAPRGGLEWGNEVWQVVKDWFPPAGPLLDASNFDAWDATQNPKGNRLVNGLLLGTGGAVASPATGTAPDGWTAEVQGALAAGTIVWGRDGDRIFVDVQGVTSSDGNPVSAVLRQDVLMSSGRYAPGAALAFGVNVEAAAGSANVVLAAPVLVDTDGTTPRQFIDLGDYNNLPMPAVAYRGRAATPVATIRTAAGTASLSARLTVRLLGTTAATGRYYFDSATLREA